MGAGRPKGIAKTGGRVKGTPNKATSTLEEKCRDFGVNPFEILLQFTKGDWKALGYESPSRISGYSPSGDPFFEDIIKPELRAKCAKDACEYIYSKKRAVEHSGEIANPYLSKPLEELEALVLEKIKK